MARGRKPKVTPIIAEDISVKISDLVQSNDVVINSSPDTYWDKPGVAQRVDVYWCTNLDELAHRDRLAQIVVDYSRPTDNIIDVGCGTGLLYGQLTKKTANLRYTGIDYSPAMLAIAKERYPNTDFRLGNVEALDYPDNWFDISCSFEVIGYSKDLDRPIAEVIRIAKRVAIFSLWCTAESYAVKGSDHWEHPIRDVRLAIDKAISNCDATVTLRDGNPVLVCVVEKK